MNNNFISYGKILYRDDKKRRQETTIKGYMIHDTVDGIDWGRKPSFV